MKIKFCEKETFKQCMENGLPILAEIPGDTRTL